MCWTRRDRALRLIFLTVSRSRKKIAWRIDVKSCLLLRELPALVAHSDTSAPAEGREEFASTSCRGPRVYDESEKNVRFGSSQQSSCALLPQSFEPPSTWTMSPVTHLASSEARKATTPPMSSGCAMCLRACIPSVASRPASVFAKFDMSVSTTPGATPLTRMPLGPSAAAKCFTIVATAPLVAAYAERLLTTACAASDETNVILLSLHMMGSSCCTRK